MYQTSIKQPSAINHSQQKSQKELFTDELIRLREDVTKSDRKAIEDELNLTRSTVSQYLNGVIRSNDTAANIISFLKKRIADRSQVLA